MTGSIPARRDGYTPSPRHGESPGRPVGVMNGFCFLHFCVSEYTPTMPFHRKAGPKRTELEHAQVFGEYSDEVAAFLRAADQYRVNRGGAPLMASDYLHVAKEIIGYRLPGQRRVVTNRWSVRIVTTTGIQARFQDAAARLGLDNGRQECGRLLGRLVAWFVYQPPRRQAEILGVLPDPVELPLGPGVGED